MLLECGIDQYLLNADVIFVECIRVNGNSQLAFDKLIRVKDLACNTPKSTSFHPIVMKENSKFFRILLNLVGFF